MTIIAAVSQFVVVIIATNVSKCHQRPQQQHVCPIPTKGQHKMLLIWVGKASSEFRISTSGNTNSAATTTRRKAAKETS